MSEDKKKYNFAAFDSIVAAPVEKKSKYNFSAFDSIVAAPTQVATPVQAPIVEEKEVNVPPKTNILPPVDRAKLENELRTSSFIPAEEQMKRNAQQQEVVENKPSVIPGVNASIYDPAIVKPKVQQEQAIVAGIDKPTKIKDVQGIDSSVFNAFKQKIGDVSYSQEKRFEEGFEDCSSAICKLYDIPNKKGSSVSAEDIYNGQFTKNAKNTDSTSIINNATDGQIVFFDNSPADNKTRKHGIDHVGVVSVDRKTGKKYLVDVTKNDTLGLNGSYVTPLELRLEQLKGAKLFVADPKNKLKEEFQSATPVVAETPIPKVDYDFKIENKALEQQASDAGLIDMPASLREDIFVAKNDAINPYINQNVFDAKTYQIDKALKDEEIRQQKIIENAVKLQIKPEHLKHIVDVNKIISPFTEEQQKKQEDYFLGSVESFNAGLAELPRTVDRALKMAAESAGFEWKNPLFSDIADAVDRVGAEGQYKVPDNIVGNVAGAMAGIAPDLIATFAMPELKLAQLGRITKGAVTRIPKFPTLLAAKEGFRMYEQAGEGADKYNEFLKGAGRGFEEGLTYEALGLTGRQAGELANALGAGKFATEATSGIANGTLFGGHSLVADPEIWNDGQIDWEKGKDAFWTNFGVGLGFHGKKLGQELVDVTTVNQSAARKAHTAFWTSTRDLVRTGLTSEKSQFELRRESQKMWANAMATENPVEKQQYIRAKTAIDNIILSRAVAERVGQNPEQYKKMINEQEGLSDKEKQFFLKRIEETAEDYKTLQTNIEKKEKASKQELFDDEAKLTYLRNKGIEIPDGTSMLELRRIYDEEKKSSPKAGTISEKPETKLTEIKSEISSIQSDTKTETLESSPKSETAENQGEQKLQEFKEVPFDKEAYRDLKEFSIGEEKFTVGEANTVGAGRVFIVEKDGVGDIGTATLSPDGTYLTNIRIDEKFRRQGIGSKVYDYIENALGYKLKPSPDKMSPSAKSFWEKRNKTLKESEVKNAEEIARQAGAGVPTQGTEGERVGQGGVRDAEQDRATEEKIADIEKRRQEELKRNESYEYPEGRTTIPREYWKERLTEDTNAKYDAELEQLKTKQDAKRDEGNGKLGNGRDGNGTAEKTVQERSELLGSKPEVKTEQESGETGKGDTAAAEKKIEREKRISEIDSELGDVWADLADIVGAKKSIAGEERKRLKPVIKKVAKLYTEKYLLKGQELIDNIKEYFSKKGISVDDAFVKESVGFTDIKKGKITTTDDLLSEISDNVTKALIGKKAKQIVKEKQKAFDKEMATVVKPMIAKIDKEGIGVKYTDEGGVERIYDVRKKSDGWISVTYKKYDPKKKKNVAVRVTEQKHRDAIVKLYNEQRAKDIKEITDKIEEKYLEETEAEIEKVKAEYIKERATELPEAPKAFSEETPEPGKTEFAKMKKQREKMPSAGTKVTVDEATALKDQIKIEVKVAREAVKTSEANFKDAAAKLRETLKGAVGKAITAGQYRGIINRFSLLTLSERVNKKGQKMSEKRAQDFEDYVKKVIDGAKYSDAVSGVKKEIERTKNLNKGDKSKFGTISEKIAELTNIDPNKLTLEELAELQAELKTINENKKAPDATSVDAVLSKFIDRMKDESVARSLNSAADVEVAIKKINKKIKKFIANKGGKVATAREYMSISRRLSYLRKQVNKLKEEGLITEAELGEFMDKLSIDPEDIGGFEKALAEYKEGYAETVHKKAKELYSKGDFTSLSQRTRLKIKELLYNATADRVKKLNITDIEALENTVSNLEQGIVEPYAAQLNRKLYESVKRENTLDNFLNKLSHSASFEKLRKNRFVTRAERASQAVGYFRRSVLQKIGLKNYGKEGLWGKTAFDNLTRLLASTKKHRLDEILKNFDDVYRMGVDTYTAITKSMQTEINERRKYEDERVKALKQFKKETKQDYSHNEMRKFGIFLQERSRQNMPDFLSGKIQKGAESELAWIFNEELTTGIPEEALNERKLLYNEILQDARKENATKKVNDKEIIDTEKYEQALRKRPGYTNLIDFFDGQFDSTWDMVEWAAYEKGRSVQKLDKYFPFIEEGRLPKDIKPEEIENLIKMGFAMPSMKSGATFERKGALKLWDLDPFAVLEKHTNDLLRAYHVYPEITASTSALKASGKEQALRNIEEFGNAKEISVLANAIVADINDVVARAYNAGRYKKVTSKGTVDFLLRGTSKAMLGTVPKIVSEVGTGYLRRTLSTGQTWDLLAKTNKKERGVISTILKQYLDDKFYGRFNEETGGAISSKKLVRAGEWGVDKLITSGDRIIGDPLFMNEFLKKFEQITGNKFDAEKYASDENYLIETKKDVHTAAAWGLKRFEELYNDKSILTPAQLKTFVGGLIKADALKTSTRVFNLFQEFNRNDVQQFNTALTRIREGFVSGDKNKLLSGIADTMSIPLSNTFYNILRYAMGKASLKLGVLAWNAIFGGQDDDEDWAMLYSAENLAEQFKKASTSFFLGGSGNVASFGTKWLMYVLEKSGTIDESQLEKYYEYMEGQFYQKPIESYGSLRQALSAVSPAPRAITDDMISGVEGLAKSLTALDDLYERGEITKKQKMEIVNTFMIGTKYLSPNPFSAPLQKQLNNAIMDISKMEKEAEEGNYPSF